MPRTVQDYADAIPLGPIRVPDYGQFTSSVRITQVEVRGSQVVATFLADKYAPPISHALRPEDVLTAL